MESIERAPLEVFAVDAKMNRRTGSIPYKSLRWVRRYREPGEFEMVLPADVYDPSWRFVCCDDRPETGMIQKVAYTDDSQTYAGIDSVTLSGYFLEAVLDNVVFLAESPESEKVYVPEPTRPVHVEGPKVYTDNAGGTYVETGEDEVAEVGTGKHFSKNGLTEVAYEDDVSTGGSHPAYSYYGKGGEVVRVDWNGEETSFEKEFDDGRGNVWYRDGTKIKRAQGVVDARDNAYFVAKKRWDALPDDDPYGRYYMQTVKGPWQRTEMLEPVTEGDSVDIAFRWARRMIGDWLLYAEPEFDGVVKKVDPSFQQLGGLMYSTLYEVGASLRLEYLFERNAFVLSAWKGKDRTQGQPALPSRPMFPAGFTELEYIESSGTQYIDTGVKPTGATRAVADIETHQPTAATTCIFGERNTSTPTASEAYTLWVMQTGKTVRSDFFGDNGTITKTLHGSRFVADKNANVCTVGGSTISNTSNPSGKASLGLFVLACNDVGAAKYFTAAKLFSMQVYEAGSKVLDLVPARRDADGEVGMLDMLSGRFLGNAGTGSFVAGPDVARPEPAPQNPWAVFSDAWGTIRGFEASRDESNYRNTCYTLFEYDVPASFDETGWPVSGFVWGVDDDLWTPTLYGIAHESRRGYITDRVGGEDEPAMEAYLDLRKEKPTCDGDWDRELVEIPAEPPEERKKALEAAKKKFAKPADAYDMRAVYDAYEADLKTRGTTFLREEHPVEVRLDTGVVRTDRYLKDWDLGDVVDMAVEAVGLAQEARIVEVEEVYEAGRCEVNIEAGEKLLRNAKGGR